MHLLRGMLNPGKETNAPIFRRGRYHQSVESRHLPETSDDRPEDEIVLTSQLPLRPANGYGSSEIP